jgi:site-specific recombinase XerD
VRALKAFSAWLCDEGFSRSDVLARLKRPKKELPIIDILTEAEIHRLINTINPACFLGSRLYAAVLLLLDTGTRASELRTLKTDDVRIEEGQIKVMGKGRKERILPICSNTKKALLRYLATWRPVLASEECDRVIVSDTGGNMTYSGLLQAIKRLGKKAGVPRLHPHLFRHSFAVKYLMKGGDVMTLRRILGHTTLDVTQIYMHLADTDIKTQHNKFSPVDGLDLKFGRKRSAK